jgi:UDP-glucose 4-epimerase
MKIFVTGIAGYLGSTFAYESLKLGHRVAGVDNFSNSTELNIEKLKKFKKDKIVFKEMNLAESKNDLVIFLKEVQPDVVIHFASLKSVSESETNPIKYWKNNLNSTINIIDSMIQCSLKKIIFSSSATIYGHSDIQPINESQPFNPISTYGSTKIAIEYFLNDVSKSGLIDGISLRYFNPIGTHKDKVIYEDIHNNPQNLMPRIIRVALGIDKVIKVFGDDYTTKDGTAERDYIHVQDLMSGHFAAIDKINNFKGYKGFNLGTGDSVSVINLIKTFNKVNNLDVPYELHDRRKGDVEICYADPSSAKKYLNWHCLKNLESMCKDSWAPYGDIIGGKNENNYS